MEKHSYVSCIKINGIPILPPMMTKDVKEEMTYYKQQAIAVEKRLAAAQDAQPNNNTVAETIRKEPKDRWFKEKAFSLDNDLVSSKSESVNFDDSSSIATVIGIPATATTIDLIKQKDPRVTNFNVRTEENCAFDTNLNTGKELDDRTSLTSRVISKVESAISGINLNPCSNETVTKSSSTNGSASETWKPQVPKTLNIVPLTLSNNSDCRVDIKYRGSDSENSSDTPKLVRQGSYVLETPSPLLLAHMQTELGNSVGTSSSEYVPTPTTNVTRRKEWNIAQAKIEWERQCKSKEIDSTDISRSSSRYKRSCPSNTEHGIRKSVSLQANPEVPFRSYLPTRSVDCIQAMLAKEYIGRSNGKGHCNESCCGETTTEKSDRIEQWNGFPCENLPVLHLAEKFGGSLGHVNNVSVPLCEHTNDKSSEKVKMGNGFEEEIPRTGEIQDSTCKLKSLITSDKLLTVYNEIQEMHRKQMTELVSRQQREQTLLQKEFEKQQLLLLTEIKKTFPEISENLSSSALDKLLPDNERLLTNADNRTRDGSVTINLQEDNETQYQRDDRKKKIPCLLDYINSDIAHCEPERCALKCSQSTQTLQGDSPSTGVDNFVSATAECESWVNIGNVKNCDKLKASCDRKRLNVSRQLFPLDSKTIHVPILDNTSYEAKHIRAASVINAYARGYLVRRMMKTERVIALKNTYKEALHCMLKLHVDAPLNRSEFNFLRRLQLQCDAASMNIVELFAQSPVKRMQVIAQDREIKRSRTDRPTSARLYSFATQRTLARKKLKEMGDYQPSSLSRSYSSRSRCQTWTSDVKEKLIPPNILHQSIKRSTSAGTVRKPWR